MLSGAGQGCRDFHLLNVRRFGAPKKVSGLTRAQKQEAANVCDFRKRVTNFCGFLFLLRSALGLMRGSSQANVWAGWFF
jgi:hypothetical protein